MKMNYYFKRIINNKLKLGVILLLMLYPIIQIFLVIEEIIDGHPVPDPNLVSFLACNMNSSMQRLLKWYLPLYLLIIVADDCIEDYILGYRQLLVSKWNKKTYFRVNILKGFVFSFVIIFATLTLNLVMANITFAGGTYLFFDQASINALESLKLSFQNPLLTNIIYILMLSVISGFVGMGAVAVSIAFHSRLLVYPTVFMMWYVPALATEKSVVLVIQPFTEYLPTDALPAIIFVLVINIFSVIFAYIKEIKYEKD